uniref:Uncharacterized protein n=1 Tax=Medicago truncatula TaxID=3880 RepID=I3S1Z9_MEDTR|nr:unknown [Medicago truncatula]
MQCHSSFLKRPRQPLMSITSISKSINRLRLLKPQIPFRQFNILLHRLVPLSSTLLHFIFRCVAVPRSGTVGDGEVEVSIKPCTLDEYGFFFGKL